jgi:hypothetical protein
MPTASDTLDAFVVSELIGLRKDRFVLERLYSCLGQAGGRARADFADLLARVQQRASGLEQVLNEIARR